MTYSTRKEHRSQRYQHIVDQIFAKKEFDLEYAKFSCNDKPFFVTRVVTELVEDGWLVSEPDGDTYCWNDGRGSFEPSEWIRRKVHGVQVTSSPQQDRPRERLLAHGVESLRDSDLIAILVRSGRPGESAVMAGEKVAREFASRMEMLPLAKAGELKEISIAISQSAYCQIMAGIELGRRIAALSKLKVKHKIGGSDDAIAFCENRFARLIADGKQEEFHVITLDTKNQVIDSHKVTVGTLDASLVHPREVFRVAIKDAASSVILVHNHPSGDPTPSREDRQVTDRLTESGKLLGIDVLDHIVLGSDHSVSIRAQ
jgi:DNA repair protein RadC